MPDAGLVDLDRAQYQKEEMDVSQNSPSHYVWRSITDRHCDWVRTGTHACSDRGTPYCRARGDERVCCHYRPNRVSRFDPRGCEKRRKGNDLHLAQRR